MPPWVRNAPPPRADRSCAEGIVPMQVPPSLMTTISPSRLIGRSNMRAAAYRIALVDPIIKAFRQQRRLLAIRPLNKTLHQPPAIQQGNHSIDGVFTQSGSNSEIRAGNREVRFALKNGLHQVSLSGPKSAISDIAV